MVKVGPATDAGCGGGDKEGIRSVSRSLWALVVFAPVICFSSLSLFAESWRHLPVLAYLAPGQGVAHQVARLQVNSGGGEAQQIAGQQVKLRG